MIRRFLIALQFLTIAPIRIAGAVNDAELAGSLTYYPLVGTALGVCSGLVFRVALGIFSPEVAAVAAVVALAVFSGALHLDGFADMCDGFYGQHPRERVLAIMKDSRSGAMAIVGVFCLLALKIALIASLDPFQILPALALSAALGRGSMVWLCAKSSYARAEGGTASAYIGHVGRRTFWIAALFCAVIALATFRTQGLVVLAAAAIATAMFRRYTERRIGGMTGDTLGACCECVEIVSLLVLCAHRGGFGL